MWVEILFLMVVLKLPVFYVCGVVWYAIRAEPEHFDGAARLVEPDPQSPNGWWQSRGRRRPRPPHGGPQRTYARVARPLGARAEARK